MKGNVIIRLVTLLILTSIVTESFGQQKTIDDFSLPREPIVHSPQVAEMIRYDQTSANQNLGRIDLTIPLVKLKDKDFDIPLSLSYNSAGFRPRDPDNYVGRDWMLNVGGIVYRHVNGVPDDISNGLEPLATQVGESYYVDGFLSVLNKRYFNLDKMDKEVWSNPYKYTYRRDEEVTQSTLPGLENIVESSADVFYFSFGKHSGKFMINYDGSVSVSGNDGGKYDVDLSGMKMFGSIDAQDTYIRVKTDDGYIYTFGGSGYSSLEYTALSWVNFFSYPAGSNKDSRNEITAYHLTEIKAPNGRKLTITYRDIDNDYHESLWLLADLNTRPQTVREEIALQYSLSGKSVRQMYRTAALDIYMNNAVYEPLQQLYSLTKTALIDCISTDMATIKFYYSNRGKHIVYKDASQEQNSFPYICGAKLDKIEMCEMSNNETVLFDYTYQSGNRMFLQKIKATACGSYAFVYNTASPVDVPTPLTYNIDHWGFWRGQRQNKGILPAMHQGEVHVQDYIITTDDRNSTGENFDYSLLHEVVYPTGGKSLFEYEPNSYSRIPQRTSFTQYLSGMDNLKGKQSDIAGGARIYTIKQCDKGGEIIKKSIFTYGDSSSTGEIMYMPCYKYVGMLKTKNGKFIFDTFSLDSEGITELPYPSIHIRYPEVTEHFVASFTEDLSQPHPYKVTRFIHYPYKIWEYYDRDFVFPTYAKEHLSLRPESFFPSSTFEEYNKNLLACPTLDMSLELGKMESECYYNSQKKLIEQTDYIYSYKNRDKYALRVYAPVTHYGLRTALYTHIMKEPFFEFSLDRKETRVFSVKGDHRGVKKDIVYYSYDKDGYLEQKTLLKSDKDSLITQYVYEHFDTSEGFQIFPVRRTISICKPGEKLALSKERWYYNSQFNSVKKTFWTLSSDNIYNRDGNLVSEYRILSTDAYGNPIETVKNGGVNTVYLWMCYGQFLAARIENATYDEVRAILGTPPESLSEQNDIASAILLLREKLLQARVYTYTYKWGVGISSETSPAGKTVYYDYDIRGRLVQIWRKDKDGKKEILQLNDYHIINE